MAANIAQNLENVLHKIEKAARKAGRAPSEVRLLAVTKGVDIRHINEAIKAGASSFGENYVQEAKEKIEKLKKKGVSWHFIGNLQKNKAKYAVTLFDMIETVDSLDLAKELSKRAASAEKTSPASAGPIDVLIEVNIAREKTKAGVDVKELDRLVPKIAELGNIRIRGLMIIPPSHENPEAGRPYFLTLRRIAERINRARIPNVSMHELSMGMSHDFEVAIEEGATIVRVGRAIFGEREKKKK